MPFSAGKSFFFAADHQHPLMYMPFNVRSSCLSWQKVSLHFIVNRVASSEISPSSRFSETEAIAVLTMTILRYKVTIKEEPQFAGETFEQRKERILLTKNMVTLTYVDEIVDNLLLLTDIS
jgi:hypothetical protein